MDSISEARLQLVCPQLAMKIKNMISMLESENIEIRVTQGMRTWDEQQQLYDQGRTTPGKIVTNAKPGYSYHNFGLAVDLVPSVNGIDQKYVPDWNGSHPAWKRMIAVGQTVGLTEGALWRTFPDEPHFQLNGFLPVTPDDSVRQLYKDQGVDAVWAKALYITLPDIDSELSV